MVSKDSSMAQFKVADITESIISGVSKSLAKIILPRVRKMIREEIDRGIKDIMLEVIKTQRIAPLQERTISESTKKAKESVTKRQARARDRARQIVERSGITNDPLLDMVINAEDAQEDQHLQLEHQMAQPMVNSNEVSAGSQITDPSQIDFTDRLEKLGIE